MAQKFSYNPATCRYEPWYLKGKALRNRVILFIVFALILGSTGAAYYTRTNGSIDEFVLQQKNQKLKIEWHLLNDRTRKAYTNLDKLIEKDDHNYRTILDLEPLQPSERKAGIGGSEKFNKNAVKDFPEVFRSYVSIQDLRHQLDVEVQSYDKLGELVDDKVLAWASRPAIQPISNKQLDRLHLTYGARLHPIFHVMMDHKGLDFAASVGTPVYATGDGKIAMAYSSGSYGNVIYLNHGHGFETRYAHLSGFAIAPGDHVKRGQVIGYVGSTGNSKAPHLHYEVLYNGGHVNPINFFQRDLNNQEYQKLIEIGSSQTTALD